MGELPPNCIKKPERKIRHKAYFQGDVARFRKTIHWLRLQPGWSLHCRIEVGCTTPYDIRNLIPAEAS